MIPLEVEHLSMGLTRTTGKYSVNTIVGTSLKILEIIVGLKYPVFFTPELPY